MAPRDIPLPRKLKHDAITEAIFELRFETQTLPEVLFGQLASYPPLKKYQQRRLPAYNLPAPLRSADINLRFQPIFELVAHDSKLLIRIGPHVLSYHQMAPYSGWVSFHRDLLEVLRQFFSYAADLQVRRLGLRYINSLIPAKHKVQSLRDLDLSITIAGESVQGNVNLNFSREVGDNTKTTVRIATPDFVEGIIPEGANLLIDVDVYTPDKFKSNDITDVESWMISAHDIEKEEFFHLLPLSVIEELKED